MPMKAMNSLSLHTANSRESERRKSREKKASSFSEALNLFQLEHCSAFLRLWLWLSQRQSMEKRCLVFITWTVGWRSREAGGIGYFSSSTSSSCIFTFFLNISSSQAVLLHSWKMWKTFDSKTREQLPMRSLSRNLRFSTDNFSTTSAQLSSSALSHIYFRVERR